MTVDTKRLKGCMAAQGMTQEAVAKAIGVDNSTFIRKMKCEGLAFSVGQMHKIVEVLHIGREDAAAIFLAQNSH